MTKFKSITDCKKLTFLLTVLLITALLNFPEKALGAGEKLNDSEKSLSEQGIEVTLTDKWLQKENKNSKKEEKLNKKPKFIYNNGKPLMQDILEEADENNLIAIYQSEMDGKLYEKYYFSNITENDVNSIKSDVIKINQEIKKNYKNYIKEITKDQKGLKQLSNSFSTAAVQPEPSGGYYRTYTWDFTNITGLKSGTFTTTLHFDRKSSSADINGTKGSVWDIKAFNEYEAKYYKINEQKTRMDVNYGAQKILSYGPYDDAGFQVGVNLFGITSGNAWTFNVGSVYTNNVSSVAEKYGRWLYNHTLDYMQDPFVTRPGLRVSNTSGNLAIKTSHTLNTSTGKEHATGVITTSIPDR